MRALAIAGCLTEETLARFIEARLPDAEVACLHRHLDQCPSCVELVGAVLRSTAPQAGAAGSYFPEPISDPRFQVLRCLGAGGMGVVYEAIDRSHRGTQHRCVALKTLRSFSPQGLLRFKQEFRSLQDLSHPNLVRYGELFESSGQWFFTMERIDGQDFIRHVRPEGDALDLGRMRAALVQLWRGLSALHDAGKVHRDIKPANVLCTPQGRLVLLDFGLVADLLPDLHRTESGVVGTIAYMAPEQATAAVTEPAADLYSVGVMLYEALTGRLPFLGPPLELLQRKQSEDPPPPVSLAPEIPADLNDLCMALLARAPQARPTAAKLLGNLAEPGPAIQPVPARPSTAFVGRQAELLSLHEALAACRGSRAIVALCEGESGIGKSALVAQFAQQIQSPERGPPGVVVLAGRCYENESVPYKALDGILDELSHWMRHLPPAAAAALVPRFASLLCQVFPVLGGVPALREAPACDIADPQERRARLFQAVRELFTRVADRRPLVLIIDDLQWADEDGRQLLSEVLREPDAPPLLLVCTRRLASEVDGEQAPAFLRGARTVVLAPLSSEEGAELVTRLQAQAGGLPGADPRDLAQEAGGHPLFIAELVRRGLRSGPPDQRLRLDQALYARVQQLEPQERHLLEHLAVSGAPLGPEVLGRALGVQAAEVRDGAGRLRGSGLIRSAERGERHLLDMYHDRVREALLQHLPAAAQRDCHLHLAQALESTPGADAEALARHFQGAGETERAAQHAERAADQAFAALAFERSARLYQTALELAPQRTELRARLGDALASDGCGPQAAAAYQAAAAAAPQQQALVLRSKAAEQLVRTGHMGPGLRVLHATLAEVGIRLPTTSFGAVLSLLWQRLKLRLRGLRYQSRDPGAIPESELVRVDICYSTGQVMSIVDLVRGADLCTRHLLAALHSGEPYRVLRALLHEASIATVRGRPGRAWAQHLLDLAQPLIASMDEPAGHAGEALVHGCLHNHAGRAAEAEPYFARAAEILRTQCRNMACELGGVQFYLGGCLFGQGEMARMGRLASEVLARARAHGDVHLSAQTLTWAVLDALAQDDATRAEQLAAEASAAWQRHGFPFSAWYMLMNQVNLALYSRQGEAANDRAKELWPKLLAAGVRYAELIYLGSLELRARATLLWALSSPGCRPRRLPVARRQAEEMARQGGKQPWVRGPVELLRAGIAAAAGDEAGAARRYAVAAAELSASKYGLYAAVARRRHGELIGGDAGQALIAEADAWMTAHGVKNPPRMCDMLAPR